MPAPGLAADAFRELSFFKLFLLTPALLSFDSRTLNLYRVNYIKKKTMKQIDFFFFTNLLILHKICAEFGRKVRPLLLCIDYCFFLRLLVE